MTKIVSKHIAVKGAFTQLRFRLRSRIIGVVKKELNRTATTLPQKAAV